MKIRSHIRHHVPDNRIHVHNGENRDGENAFAPLLIFNLGFSLHYVFWTFRYVHMPIFPNSLEQTPCSWKLETPVVQAGR